MTLKFDSSWDYGLFSLWGWLCCSDASSDNELRNEIAQLHAEAKEKFPKLKVTSNKKSQRAITKREWKLLIDDLDDKPVTYADGLAKRDALQAMVDGIASTLLTEKAEALAAKSDAARSSIVADEDDEYEDDDAFALHFAGPSSVTSTQPIRVKPRAPRTPAEVWADRLRQMTTDCDDIQSKLQPNSRASAGFGAHLVTQASVLNGLPRIASASWGQGRPDAGGSEVRVFVAVVNEKVVRTVWANGLSHDPARRANTHTVYEQTSPGTFNRLSVAKHPQEYP